MSGTRIAIFVIPRSKINFENNNTAINQWKVNVCVWLNDKIGNIQKSFSSRLGY